jgi:hypothetical protein
MNKTHPTARGANQNLLAEHYRGATFNYKRQIIKARYNYHFMTHFGVKLLHSIETTTARTAQAETQEEKTVLVLHVHNV